MSDVDVLVIGGGVSGLAVASYLARAGVTVEVWERSQHPGGKIKTDVDDAGYVTERAASMMLNFRPEVNQFLELTDLAGLKTPLAPRFNRYVLKDERLVLVPMKIGAMLRSPLWSLHGKLRLALELFIPKGGNKEETVSEFITRRLGRELLEKAMEPYISGPLASDPDLANAFSALPRLTALEQRYGSLTVGVLIHKTIRRQSATATEAFSFKDGMSTLIDTLVKAPGVRVRPAHSAEELAKCGTGWRITGNSAGAEVSTSARQVVLSTPAAEAARLIRPLDGELAQLLDGIEYAPVAAVHTGFARSAVHHRMDGTGFLIPRRAGLTPTGCMWMSSLFENRAPAGKVLLTSYLGGARLPAAAKWNDNRSVAEILQVLRPLLGIRGEPEMVRIDRHRHALPLYHGAYHDRMKAVTQRLQCLPDLHLEANYRGGVSVRDRIVCADAAARRILTGLRPSSDATVSAFPTATPFTVDTKA